jgi:hypothetical protein
MTSGTGTFNPQELCSRKLWDMVNADNADSENKLQLDAAIAELEERRSYLEELQHIGKSSSDSRATR